MQEKKISRHGELDYLAAATYFLAYCAAFSAINQNNLNFPEKGLATRYIQLACILLQLILLFFTIMISGVSHMQNKWG
jgi:hypothetical protein